MGKEELKEQLSYLEEERKKIWIDITNLKNEIKKQQETQGKDIEILRSEFLSSLPKDLADLKQSCKKSTEYRNKIFGNFNETTQKAEKISNAYTEVLNNVKIIEDSISKTKEIDSKSDELQKIESVLQESISRNKDIFDDLSKKIADTEDLFSDITEKGETVDETFEKINNLLQQSLKLKTEITLKYQKIFGYKTTNKISGEEEFVPGTLDELDDCYRETQAGFQKLKSDFDEFKEKERQETKNIKDKIKSLLPDAMTAGLAGAFTAKRERENEEMSSASKSFSILLWAMAIIALIPFAIYAYWFHNGKGIDFIIDRTINVSIAFIPLYAPFVWLAIHLNKKINLSKKLIEEYCYKETISKTVEGLSNQIKQIDDNKTSKTLHTKLLTLLLETSADNPGKYITKYDKCDNPAIELLSRLEKLGHLSIKTKDLICDVQMDKDVLSTEKDAQKP